MQLGSQLRTRCAGADNRHVQLAGTYWRLLCLCADAGIHQKAIKAFSVGGGFQLHRMFGNARRAEVVGDAADREYQCVVADGSWWGNLMPFVVEHGGEVNLLCSTVSAESVAEPGRKLESCRTSAHHDDVVRCLVIPAIVSLHCRLMPAGRQQEARAFRYLAHVK